MTLYDRRNVAKWLQFETDIKQFMSVLASHSYSTFVITNNGVYVFNPEGGVGKVVNTPVTYSHGNVSEYCVGNRWDCLTTDGAQGKIEKVNEIYLGQIIPSSPFNIVFRSAKQTLNIVWGKEQELATSLTAETLQRLMKNRVIQTPVEPINLNVRYVLTKRSTKTK